MTDRPTIANAPGLTWRPLKNGWEARWRPRTDLVRRGYRAEPQRLWTGTEPTEEQRAYISDRCNFLQAEMLVWGRGGIPQISAFDGSVRTLVGCYQTDADSTYRKLRYKTRQHYDHLCGRLLRDHADELLADIKARTLLRWHEDWSAGGKIAMGHHMIGMVRTLVGFGATILEDPECERLCGVLHKMRFQMPKARDERITAEQVIAVREAAHAAGLHSIALAQALQFELMLRQKDVIGEWVPSGEPGLSDVTAGGWKWLRGVRWSEMDRNLILRHVTSKRQKPVECNLRLAPMVMEELARYGDALPSQGPMIVSETRGRPYINHEFRRDWRKAARKAGVPDAVFNMDSRAGAISEATDAGAELEHVRHAATHSSIATTQRYSRGGTQKAAGVMKLRAVHRNKPRTDDGSNE